MNDSDAIRSRPDGQRLESSVIWDDAAVAFDRWLRGAPGAMDELVTTMTPVLWHVVRAYGLTRDLAQDVIQTTWLTLVQRSGSINDSHAIAAWLMTTARREAWRVAKRGATQIPVADEVLHAALDDESSAEDVVLARDGDSRLWACVKGLSERCQRLLRIVAFEQRPDYTRIARDLGMPIGSIGPTRGRCLSKLREALESSAGAR
ncbi:sigma-70 family RNA polymerase sigma factor [Lacisediminihabitans sp.]|jgi:RNA polymerase sigma factor (sigma-70 family)|uniref:RNA polymerase sigma factor n=1 Tax=Lacisediminihabitans sp. TaxID=2787631 RepID=UPI002F93F131